MGGKTQEARKEKKDQAFVCPRRGLDLHGGSEIGLNDNSFYCWKCGYSTAGNVQETSWLLTDMDMDGIRIG